MRMRIMNLPGVGFRKKTPTHLSRSLSAGERFSWPRAIKSARLSRTRNGFHHCEAFNASTELRRRTSPSVLVMGDQLGICSGCERNEEENGLRTYVHCKPLWCRSRSEEHTSELQSPMYLVCR